MKPSRRVRLAAALWVVLAFLVWNVVFDRMIVLAGRRYSYDATVSARQKGVYLRVDDAMRPATSRAVRVASSAAAAVALVGLAAVAVAARRDQK